MTIRIACDLSLTKVLHSQGLVIYSFITPYLCFGDGLFPLNTVMSMQHKERDEGVFVIYQDTRRLEKNMEWS